MQRIATIGFRGRVPIAKAEDVMNVTLSIMMLAAIALLAGSAFLWFARSQRKQAGLMALLAFIMIANVAIWTVPDKSGEAPISAVEE